jgi:hypothetical protein
MSAGIYFETKLGIHASFISNEYCEEMHILSKHKCTINQILFNFSKNLNYGQLKVK